MKNFLYLIRSYGLIVNTVAFIYILILYGFDISFTPKGRVHAIVAIFANEESNEHFYKVNEHFGYLYDEDYGDDGIRALTYDANYIPYCFTCGASKPSGEMSLDEPYKKGDLLYTIRPKMHEYPLSDNPIGSYATYNIKTGKQGYVNELEEIAPDAEDDKYKIRPHYISSNFKEISFFKDDDIDCFEAFSAIYFIYALLGFWYLILLIRKKFFQRKAQ